MLETQTIYAHADLALKKVILELYSSVGGWDVLSILIRAVSEPAPEINDLAWRYLQKWRDKALNLFTRPPEDVIVMARYSYDNSSIDIAAIAASSANGYGKIFGVIFDGSKSFQIYQKVLKAADELYELLPANACQMPNGIEVSNLFKPCRL